MNKLFLIAPAFLLMACGAEESTEDTTTITHPEPVTEEVVVKLSPDEEIEAYLTEKGWTGVRHESGLYVVTDEPGKGDARPTLMDEVTIYYQGYLLDGHKFDGTVDAPATFPLSNLIQGWQIGIPMFGKGGKGKLIFPASLGYGEFDNGDIPGGSTLMFEIELVDWKPTSTPQ